MIWQNYREVRDEMPVDEEKLSALVFMGARS